MSSPRFVVIDRDTPLLLPPDLRDWVPEDDLVHFVIAAVDRLPLEYFTVNWRGSGSAQHPPHMMLALLIYSYAMGVFSSRKIERATHRDVAVRYLTADTHPDHDTVCKFRRENLDAFAAAFVDVLELAREMGLLKVGRVSLDGSHFKADASIDGNVTHARATELRAELEADIAGLLEEAERADLSDEDADKLPREIARRERLHAKMEGAIAELEIISFTFDGATATITFASVSGRNYAVEQSPDLTRWDEVDDPTAVGPMTTVTINYDPVVIPRMYLRVREF